jgi:outer membrane immunogenic protein
MLRKILLSSAMIAFGGAAFAADLPARVAAPAPYVAAPIFTWTGFYVGLNAGAGWNNNHNGFGTTFNTTTNPVFIGSNNNDAGFTGGAQAGYNMQFGAFVAGIEADINYIDRSNNGTAVIPSSAFAATGTFYTVNHSSGDNWFGTVRGRVGVAFDRALIYATGGLAFGGNRGDAVVTQYTVTTAGALPTGVAVVGNGNSNNNVGWALGGGLEYAFSNAWSVKAEYLHVDLGNHGRSFAVATPAGGIITVSDNNRFDVVRAGVNFRF